jgi:hypothetical protein
VLLAAAYEAVPDLARCLAKLPEIAAALEEGDVAKRDDRGAAVETRAYPGGPHRASNPR